MSQPPQSLGSEPGGEDPAVDLLAELLDALEDRPELDIDAFVAGRPEQAAAVRAAFEQLVADGLVRRPERDRYALGEEIGRGGMGRVVRAYDRDLCREVAIKSVRPDLTDAAAVAGELGRRFRREALVAARLEHPNVMPTYGFTTDREGWPMLVMRLLQGRDLRALVEQRVAAGVPPGALEVEVMERVCDGLEFAHGRGVVHRDLKPSNVVVELSADGSSVSAVYVVDWGVAKLLGEQAMAGHGAGADAPAGGAVPSEALTSVGQRIGSLSHMAPEQAGGRFEAIDARTDVFGAGALLYHLLTGNPPYSGSDRVRLRERASTGLLSDPRAHHSRRPAAPRELLAVCRKAMQPDPAARYPDIAALRADLQAFHEHRPGVAWRDRWPARTAKWVARHPTAATGLAGTVLLSALAVAVEASLEPLRAERDRLRHEHREASLTATLRRLAQIETGGGSDMAVQMQRYAASSARALNLLASWGVDLAGSAPLAEQVAVLRAERPAVRRELVGAVLLLARHISLAGLAEASIYTSQPARLARVKPGSWRGMARRYPAQVRAWPRLLPLLEATCESPATAEAQRVYADWLVRRDGVDRAELTIPDDAPDAEAYFCAWVSERVRGPDTALEGYRRIVAADPQNLWGHLRLAVLCLERGLTSEALAEASAGRALWPASATAANLIAAALEKKGEPERAVAVLRAALAHDGRHVPNLFNLAQLLAAQGDRDGAIELLERAFALEPDDVEVRLRLGAELRQRAADRHDETDLARAARVLERARELAPASWQVNYQLGLAEQAAGAHERAIACFDQALRTVPSQPAAWRADLRLDRARSLAESGQVPDALDECLAMIKEAVLPFDASMLFMKLLPRLGVEVQERYQKAWQAERR